MMGRINQYLYKFKLDKPIALQWHEWEEWESQMQAERPFAYWLNETAPDAVKRTFRSLFKPFNDLRYFIRVRLFDRYHVIQTGLKPGYADCDARMLNGMFNMLVDFVEIEKAWKHVVFSKEEQAKRKHPWWSLGWTRFKAFRDPAAGLDHLRWEMSLDDPELPDTERCDSQAHAAREISELYHWWKEVRPQRPDPYDASGWTVHCEQRRESGKHMLDMRHDSEEEEKETQRMLDMIRKIEHDYLQEDEDQLIRLVKIRPNLWT